MDFCVLVDDKLNMSHPYALKAEKRSHRLCEQDAVSRSMEVIIPLYSVLVRPHLDRVHPLGIQYKRQTDKVQRPVQGLNPP